MPYADPKKRAKNRREYARKKRLENPEVSRSAWRKDYYKNHSKHLARQRAKYARMKKNPVAYSKYLKWCRDRRKQRYWSDPIYRLYCNVRSKIIIALQRNKNQKRGKTETLIGCSILKLREHLEKQFKDGMSWQNKSLWHIDHKRPCASFDLSNPDQVLQCFHYSNLVPLWGEENRRKWAHYDGYYHRPVRHL